MALNLDPVHTHLRRRSERLDYRIALCVRYLSCALGPEPDALHRLLGLRIVLKVRSEDLNRIAMRIQQRQGKIC